MHARGWISIYCMPLRPCFKGSAPINLSDRLNQVLRWALGSVEILLSRHCPIWYGYNGRLKLLERLAYINTIVYPITSIPLIAYCVLPAICLLTNKFIIPEVSWTESFKSPCSNSSASQLSTLVPLTLLLSVKHWLVMRYHGTEGCILLFLTSNYDFP